jgi:hypothetical protein
MGTSSPSITSQSVGGDDEQSNRQTERLAYAKKMTDGEEGIGSSVRLIPDFRFAAVVVVVVVADVSECSE